MKRALIGIGASILIVGVVYAAFTISLSSTVEINSSTTNGPTLANGDFFGFAAANIGDLNDDGVNDLIVGAIGDDEGGLAYGAAHILFLTTTGAVLSTVEIDSSTPSGPELTAISDNFGSSVAGIGDLNDDGVEDIAVGARGDDEGGSGRGAVHILFLTTTGGVLSTSEINSSSPNGPTLTNGDNFGSAVDGIGDLNGDGVEDIVVGAYADDEGGGDRGAVHILFLTTTGAVVSTSEINSSTANGPTLSDADQFGYSVANVGDLNNDGVTDIVVGAPQDAGGGSTRGAAHILFLNTDASVDSTVEINDSTANGPVLVNSDNFGVGAAGMGDLNDDGVEDIAVGASGDDEGGSGRGAVHILLMNTDGSVSSTVEINSSTSNGPTLSDSDNFGFSVANIGDLNGDGVTDMVSGAFADSEGGSSRGAVHVLFLSRVATSSGGSGYQHRRIRERYAEIAAGLHGSAEEERNDTEPPSLSDVGIFVPDTTVVAEDQEEADEQENEVPLSRKVLQVLDKLQNVDEEIEEQQVEAPELTPFQQRVCERVWRRFSGSSLERVNERLQKRLGFVCEE